MFHKNSINDLQYVHIIRGNFPKVLLWSESYPSMMIKHWYSSKFNIKLFKELLIFKKQNTYIS